MKYQLIISFDADILRAIEVARETQGRFLEKAEFQLREMKEGATTS